MAGGASRFVDARKRIHAATGRAERGARRVLVAALLDKQGHRAADIEADFLGFPCPDVFVVGYGMDMAHAFRELPFVGHLRKRAQ